jgi:hypothetical protein
VKEETNEATRKGCCHFAPSRSDPAFEIHGNATDTAASVPVHFDDLSSVVSSSDIAEHVYSLLITAEI